MLSNLITETFYINQGSTDVHIFRKDLMHEIKYMYHKYDF